MSKPSILIADDDADIRLALAVLLSQQGFAVHEVEQAEQVVERVKQLQPDLVLLDMNFRRDTTSGEEGLALLTQLNSLASPIILMTAWSQVSLAVAGLKLGAVDFIEKPWHNQQLLNCINEHLASHQTKQAKQTKLTHSKTEPLWIALSPTMQQLEQMITQLAPTDANILILGENGTGKSQLAQRIHQLSTRQQQPLVAVNMAAIPETLFESELFGHVKGAFTDAKQHRTGRIEQAQQGTLFLDEIGSLPLNLQTKLLRVLESGEYEKLGSDQTLKNHARLISATNTDLNQAINNGRFRQDLFYRLNTFTLELPPLKQRAEDIEPLAEAFIDRFCSKYQKPSMILTEQAKQRLLAYDWPGNIRQLSHLIERAVLINQASEITAALLNIPHTQQTIQLSNNNDLVQLEQQAIVQALQQHNGVISKAAAALNISRNALYRRLEKYQIDY